LRKVVLVFLQAPGTLMGKLNVVWTVHAMSR